MVRCKYVIHQRVNSVLDRLYFKRYSQIIKAILNQLIAPRTNIRTMSKVDNNNNYNYNLQASDEKHTG